MTVRVAPTSGPGTRSPSFLILGYHGVSRSWRAEFSVRPDRFRRQIELVLAKGYCPSTLSGGAEASDGLRFAVTFDDAFRSVLDTAYPILEEYGCPATVFVVTNWPGSAAPQQWKGLERWVDTDADELVSLTWDDLRALAGNGWEIGSHTCSHPRLTKLDSDALRFELRESKARIEHELGAECASFCAPYGVMSPSVLEAIRLAGYRFSCTSLVYPFEADLALRRTAVSHVDNLLMFRVKVSGAARVIRFGESHSARALRRGYTVARRTLSEM